MAIIKLKCSECGHEEDFSLTQHKKQTRAPRTYQISIDVDKNKFIGITSDMADAWQEAYPTVDLVQMLKSMIQYYKINPSKTDWYKTILNRLEKSQRYNLYPRTPKKEIVPQKDYTLVCSDCGGTYKVSDKVCPCTKFSKAEKAERVLGGKIIT